MTKRTKQAQEYAAESYGKADEKRGDSDTERCGNEPRDGAVCQDSLQKNLTLTDEEREAIEWSSTASANEQRHAADAADRGYAPPCGGKPREWAERHAKRADTLRRLLERTK